MGEEKQESEPIPNDKEDRESEVDMKNTSEIEQEGMSTEEQIKNIENEIALLKSDIEASEKQASLRATSSSDDSMDEFMNSDEEQERKRKTPVESAEKISMSNEGSKTENSNIYNDQKSIHDENSDGEEALEDSSFNIHDEDSNKSDTFEGVKDKMIGNFEGSEIDMKMLSGDSSEEDSQ